MKSYVNLQVVVAWPQGTLEEKKSLSQFFIVLRPEAGSYFEFGLLSNNKCPKWFRKKIKIQKLNTLSREINVLNLFSDLIAILFIPKINK